MTNKEKLINLFKGAINSPMIDLTLKEINTNTSGYHTKFMEYENKESFGFIWSSIYNTNTFIYSDSKKDNIIYTVEREDYIGNFKPIVGLNEVRQCIKIKLSDGQSIQIYKGSEIDYKETQILNVKKKKFFFKYPAVLTEYNVTAKPYFTITFTNKSNSVRESLTQYEFDELKKAYYFKVEDRKSTQEVVNSINENLKKYPFIDVSSIPAKNG